MAAERPMKRLIRAKSDDKSKKIATCDSQDDLFSDEEDQRYLDSLGDDYTREKELTRRFEQWVFSHYNVSLNVSVTSTFLCF